MVEPTVRFHRVSKRFRLGESTGSAGILLAPLLRRVRLRPRPCEPEAFWALRNVDFEAAQGEAIGVIGPNGAGKSTVLRLLARILEPDAGTITVHGRVAALIEIGAGFHGDLTGRENVFLHGAILGMNRREIRRRFDEIVSFAGLERFMDTPVKRYSSGMYARLGFSIAAHVDPRVLLIDEVLSVGDALFRLRCMERMRALIHSGSTLVFVTHQLEQMQAICRRAIVLSAGEKTFDGDPRSAVSHYMNAVASARITRPTDIVARDAEGAGMGFVSLCFRDRAGAEIAWTRPHEPLTVDMTLDVHRPIRQLVLEWNLRSDGQAPWLSVNSGRDSVPFTCDRGRHRFTLELPSLPVCGGQYAWNLRAWDMDRGTTELDTPFQFGLGVDDEGRAAGSLTVPRYWAHAPLSPGNTDSAESSPEEAVATA